MNPLLELRKQMEIDFLKTKTYEEINDMFNKLNDKLKIAEGKVKNISSNTLLEEGLTISSSERYGAMRSKTPFCALDNFVSL